MFYYKFGPDVFSVWISLLPIPYYYTINVRRLDKIVLEEEIYDKDYCPGTHAKRQFSSMTPLANKSTTAK